LPQSVVPNTVEINIAGLFYIDIFQMHLLKIKETDDSNSRLCFGVYNMIKVKDHREESTLWKLGIVSD
jgi:hypothetical protein